MRELNSGKLLLYFPWLVFKREVHDLPLVFHSFFATDTRFSEYFKVTDKKSKEVSKQATGCLLIARRQNGYSSPSFCLNLIKETEYFITAQYLKKQKKENMESKTNEA